MEAAAAVTNALGEQLGRLSKPAEAAVSQQSAIGCADPWVNYCNSVHAAVRHALARGHKVAVVAQPRLRKVAVDDHARQQAMLAAMMAREFSAEPRVRFIDLSAAVDLADANLTFDPMHLNAQGNATAAAALADALQSFMTQ
jgi:hypothetical protein